MRHPYSSLAAYVEGTATTRERATAEAHLASCAACRKDVTRARRARAALASLTEVEAPGVDVAAVVQRAEALRARAGAKAAAGQAAAAAVAASATEARRARPIADGEVAPPAPFEEALARAQGARAEAEGAVQARAQAEPVSTPAPPTTPEDGATITELPAEGERVRRRRERDRTWQLRVVQGALGAAAVLVAIVLFVGLRNPPAPTTARDRAAEGGAAPESSPPTALGAVQDFNDATFRAYAEDLAEEVRTNDATDLARADDAIAATPRAGQNATEEEQAIACLNRNTDLVGGTHLYSLIRATFESRPVYVGAFLSNLDSEQPDLLVIAASVEGCDLVQLAQQPL